VSGSRPTAASLFVTCLVDQFFPEVGEGVVKVLRHLGLEVDFPPAQTCCGQPAFNGGYQAEALVAARRFLEVFQDSKYIVAPSGSCTAMVRVFYPELLRNDPKRCALAQSIAARTYEFSELLVNVLGVTALGARLPPTRVTYHDACHGLRELGIRQEPRALLNAIGGVELVESPRHEVCCGFGGTFSVKYPEISTAMLRDKLDDIRQTGADLVVAADSSCLMHIGGGLSRLGMRTRPIHLAQLLADALESPRG
jgi:L-lactate dehydrogenase complex protein LldE